jgi:hypothetical protein
MRALLSLALLLGAFAVGRASDVTFVRVWPEWRTAESFTRISEYFTGQENTGSRIVLRSQPLGRSGFYFLARVKNAGPALPDAKLVLSIIKPDSPLTRIYSFPIVLAVRESVFEVGLTGPDWPGGSKIRPVAWKLELLAADGAVLAAEKSFLWEKPDKK